jgi:hypothetical protein
LLSEMSWSHMPSRQPNLASTPFEPREPHES